MNAGHYDHYQYLKGNYVNSLFFAPESSADVQEIILFLEISQVISIQSQLLFLKNKAACFSCSVSYYQFQFIITNWYFS